MSETTRQRAPYGTALRRHFPFRELHDSHGARVPDDLWELAVAQQPSSGLSMRSYVRWAIAQYLAQPARMPVRWTRPPQGMDAHPTRAVALDQATREAVAARARRDRVTRGMVIGAAFAWAAASPAQRAKLARRAAQQAAYVRKGTP